MGSSEMDQRIRDDTHNHTKTSNDVCRHKDELLYGSKTASKWNDKTGSDTSVDILTQIRYLHRRLIMKETGAVTPMRQIRYLVPDETSPQGGTHTCT